jgi:hypothetical protein
MTPLPAPHAASSDPRAQRVDEAVVAQYIRDLAEATTDENGPHRRS